MNGLIGADKLPPPPGGGRVETRSNVGTLIAKFEFNPKLDQSGYGSSCF